MPGGQERIRRENGIEGKWCRRETRSKRWVWRLLGGEAIEFFGGFGKAPGLSLNG